MIIIGGMIGLGKTSIAKIISKELNFKVFYENVDDNPILPLFYNSSEEDIHKNRYSFLLQLNFLNNKFKSLKDANKYKNSVLDRSIYEDWYFCKKNMELGRISKIEMDLYESLLDNMISGMDKKDDLFIYLRGSFKVVLERIKLRGRYYEVDKKLESYYKYIWEGYDEWIYNHYDISNIITVDMDKVDIINNERDKENLINNFKIRLNINDK